VSPLALTAAAAAVAAAVGFGSGWTARGWKEDAKRLEVERALVRSQQALARQMDRAVEAYEDGRAAADVREVEVVKEVTRVVSKPVYLERCLDDDGLRVIAADIDAANARRGLAAEVPADPDAR
jgi:hypothetical protein